MSDQFIHGSRGLSLALVVVVAQCTPGMEFVPDGSTGQTGAHHGYGGNGAGGNGAGGNGAGGNGAGGNGAGGNGAGGNGAGGNGTGGHSTGGEPGGGGSGGSVTPGDSCVCAGCSCKALARSNASVSGYNSDVYTWFDESCRERSAAMVRNDQRDPRNLWGGYMRRMVYRTQNAVRTCEGAHPDHPGFGMVVNHFSNTATISQWEGAGDYRTVLLGAHHAIHEYTWTYRMHGHMVDITVHWFFATGRDHPVYAITFDTSNAPPDAVQADTRSPYGDIQWDGGIGANVDGVGWGDRYKFISLHSPITMSSGWDYSEPNIVPYVLEWSVAADAEMGLVQTQTQQQHHAGGYWFYDKWGDSDPNGPMPEDWNWTYQLNQYELPWGSGSKRLAWGMNYGAVGMNAYNVYGNDATADGHPYQSYSVHIVLGQHSENVVFAQVEQVERVQQTVLTASVGTVRTKGPAGVGRSDEATYQPVGYNHVYGTWELNAASNQVDFTLAANDGALVAPVFVVHNWTAGAPCAVLVDGNDIGCGQAHVSVDAATSTLWLTLRDTFDGSHRVVVQATGCP